MVRFLSITNSPLVRVTIVTLGAKLIASPGEAPRIACRKDPDPLSFPLQTAYPPGHGVGAGVGVGIADGTQYLPPVFNGLLLVTSAPDDHFTASPDCRVRESTRRRIGGAGSYPKIDIGIVSPAGVQTVGAPKPPQTIMLPPVPAPGVERSGIGRVASARGCPRSSCWGCIGHQYSMVRVYLHVLHPRRSFRYRSKLR